MTQRSSQAPDELTEAGSGLRAQSSPRNVSPTFRAAYFSCPRCGVASFQQWIDLHAKEYRTSIHKEVTVKITDIAISRCGTCSARSLWFEKELIFPATHDAPAMSPDMPPELQKDYEEAAAVAAASPRAAAALLRMCIEGLCKKLTGASSFEDAISQLVKQGMPSEIQLALDIIRQNGNEVMHAGQLYGDDDNATVVMLFKLVNSAVAWAITEKRQLRDLYNQIPEEKRQKLEARRAAKQTK